MIFIPSTFVDLLHHGGFDNVSDSIFNKNQIGFNLKAL